MALINYGLEFLHGRGYTPNQPPYFMLREAMAKTAQLEDFDNELYKVTDDGTEQSDKYLVSTIILMLIELGLLMKKDCNIRAGLELSS